MLRSVYVPQLGRVAHDDYGWDEMIWNGVQPLDAHGNRFCPPASAKRQAQIGGNVACAAPVPTGKPISGIGPAISGIMSILQHPKSGTVTLPSASPGVGLPFSAILPILQSTTTTDVSTIG